MAPASSRGLTRLRRGALWGMNYYSDDYPDIPREEFLAVYEGLTKYAQREVRDLAECLSVGTCMDDGVVPRQPE